MPFHRGLNQPLRQVRHTIAKKKRFAEGPFIRSIADKTHHHAVCLNKPTGKIGCQQTNATEFVSKLNTVSIGWM